MSVLDAIKGYVVVFLFKVPTWWLEWDSNKRPSGHKAPNLPLSIS